MRPVLDLHHSAMFARDFLFVGNAGRSCRGRIMTLVAKTCWEHFAHDADIGVRGYGPTLATAFEQAALALTAVVTDQPVATKMAVKVECEGADPELLFVDWLNAIIYEMAVNQMIFGRYEVKIEDHRLHGTLWGEPADPIRHTPACEPKGATYTMLRVAQDADGTWSAGCIVDV